MTDDYYIFNEKNFTLTGRRNKKRFSIGMDVRIIVDKVDTEEREILFSLV